MAISDTRSAIATAINDASLGFTVQSTPIKSPKASDGWVAVASIVPGVDSFTGYDVTFNVVLLLASESNSAYAEGQFDVATDLVDVLMSLYVSGLTIEPATVPVAGSAFLALVATFTMEV